MNHKTIGSILLVAVAACGTRSTHESDALSGGYAAAGFGGTSDAEIGSSKQPLFVTSASNYFSQSASEVAAISRGTNLLDLFRIEGDVVKLLRWDGTTWQPDQDLGNPPGVTSLQHLNATKNGTRADLFVVGSDHHIWHRYSDSSGTVFSAWAADVPGNPTLRDNSSVAVTSWEAGRMDIFWWTQIGNIGHAWYIDNAPHATETGDSPGAPWFRALQVNSLELSATSPAPGIIHLVYASPTDFYIVHHWFDGSWGSTAAPNREFWALSSSSSVPNGPPPEMGAGGGGGRSGRGFGGADGSGAYFLKGTSVSVTSTGPNNLEIFMRGVPSSGQPHIYHTAFNGQWETTQIGALRALVFEEVSHPNTETPASLCTAIQWATPTPRMDLYGVGGPNSTVWQAVQ